MLSIFFLYNFIDNLQQKIYNFFEVKNMKEGNKFLAEITYLRMIKGISFQELASKVGVSAFWLREKIKEGNLEYIEKAKKYLN